MTPNGRAPNGTGFNGLPAWLRAAVFLGVPSLIAIFLVYMLSVGLVRRVTAIETTQQVQGRILETLAADVAARSAEAIERQRILERLIRQTCVVAAATDDGRASCLAP